MKAPSFAQLPTVRRRIQVEFDVLDPRTGIGTRSRIPIEVDVPEDRHGISPPDGVYANAGRGQNRLVTYCRVGDVSFAPLVDVAIGNCPDFVLEDPDPGRQLEQLKFTGRYALPRRFDEVLSFEGPLHAATGRRIENRWSIPTETFEEIERSGREVIDREVRVAAVREAASRCFLVRRNLGLCIAAEQPVWGAFERGEHSFVQLHILAPDRRQHDVFGLLRKEAAMAFASEFGGPGPTVSGQIVAMPIEPQERDEPTAVLAGESARIARVLRDLVGILPAEAVAFWHDCTQGAAALRGYGSAADMLGLVSRIEAALHDRPATTATWRAETRCLRRRLAFEANIAPASPAPRITARP